MAHEFVLSIVAPDKAVAEERVTSVIAPGLAGYFGVMAGHEAMIAALRPGLLEYVDVNGTRHFVYIGGGFAEVGGDRMTVLADEASRAADIDAARAEEGLENARRALRGESSGVSGQDAVAEVEKALQRLRAARAGR